MVCVKRILSALLGEDPHDAEWDQRLYGVSSEPSEPSAPIRTSLHRLAGTVTGDGLRRAPRVNRKPVTHLRGDGVAGGGGEHTRLES